MTPPFPNSYWLEHGRILCGEYPRDFDDLEDHEGMTAILQSGVRVFLDLTEEGELKPYRDIALATAASLAIAPGELTFLRHPIRDMSVPQRTKDMRDMLRSIRLERHRGRTLYLHCWGGRGRTGTVAGCVLNELFGHRGNEALAVLSSRWQACAKAAFSESPETEEQRCYVREWNPAGTVTPPVVRAALLGAAIGDALGVPVEFQGRAARQADPVTGMRAFGTHHQPAGTWSDDTSMILATMTGLIDSGTYDPTTVMRQFCLWMNEARHTPHGVVFDIGNATREALIRSHSGIPPLECGGKTEWSNGNGSLMRILPIALAYADDPDLIEKASEISSLTHAHERSCFCSAFYCLVASDLMHGGSIEQATAFAWEILDHRWTFTPAERHHFEALHPTRLFAREEDTIRSSGHVIDTLEAALWVNARHDDFADTVLHAVNLGDDTDTTGCVAGGLAGLVQGEGAIPGEWVEGLVKREELMEMAELFAGFCKVAADKGSMLGNDWRIDTTSQTL